MTLRMGAGAATAASSACYYGYWAWEAGAMAYLYQLNDGAYRDDLLYPKDMVDWARVKGQPPKEFIPSVDELPNALSARPGQACPKAGVWYAPNLRMQEVKLKAGELMPGPKVATRSGNEVIW